MAIRKKISAFLDFLKGPAHAAVDHPEDGGITGDRYPEEDSDNEQ